MEPVGEEEAYENQRAYLAKKGNHNVSCYYKYLYNTTDCMFSLHFVDPPRRSKSTPKHSQILPPREPEPPVKKKSKEAIISCEADANYPCEDPNPWPVCDSYKPDANHPLNAFVSEVRLEFRDKNIKPNPGAEGRVFFDALKATKVDSVLLKVNYNITYGAEDGTQIKGAESNTYDIQLVGRTAMPTKNPPTLPDAEGKMKGAFKLTEGANEIPFKLTFPTDSIPTFTYVTDDGRTAISSYSVEAVVTLEKQTIQLGRLALTFPSFGMKKSPVGPQDVGTFKLALENKYCTPDSGLSLLVLDERGKTKSMSYKIARKVKCSALGLDGAQTIVYEGKLNKVKDSEILKRMKQQGVQIPEGYKAVFDESIPKELTLLPRSVAIDGFTCTYEIEVKCGKSETYETDIVVCDHLLDAPFQPRYLPEAVKNETGWRKIEKSK
ncbi:unnamed protein product [Schistocephalus solidus]|uniref:Arrestin_N domain-containing protein n=1 Tax=Schistocephalus solidus TaxID=70667 RepID=A0A183TCX8_SCHSO|nr:unnamed protein product [Schistocephalus solidus]